MDKPRDPVAIELDRVEVNALLDLDLDSTWTSGPLVRARQRLREGLGTDSLHRAVKAHRESRSYWPG